MKKVIIYILVAVICLGAGVCTGFYFGRAAKKSKEIKPSDGTQAITAETAEVTLGESLFELIAASPDRWSNQLVSNYGMSESKRDDLIAHPENWLAFNLFIDIKNPGDTEILVDSLSFDGGEKGFYFMNKLQGQISIAPKSTDQICVYFFVDDNEPSLEEVAETVKGLDLYVRYTPMPADLEAEIPEDAWLSAKVEAK